MRKTGIILSGLLVCGLFLTVLFIAKPLYQFYTHTGFRGETPSILIVKRNNTLWDVVKKLHAQGILQHPRVIYYFTRLNNTANNIKAGVYAVNAEDTAVNILQKIEKGDVLELPFTIIAGKRWNDIKRDISKAQWLNVKEENSFSVLGKPVANPEGLLLADTYLYDANSNSDHLLERANRELDEYLEFTWKTRKSGLPYKNAYEMLIAASIIEKETAVSEERALIASVIVNRLHRNMRLQMDPTVIYAMGETWNGSLNKNDLQIDSPYNTYRYRGLPPTPIAMVSRASLDAAAHPKSSTFLYFVAKGDGTHKFSSNYSQQQIAVQQYLKRGE